METLSARLCRCQLLCRLPPEVVAREILPHGHCQEYQKGQFLITQQQRVDRLGLILSGRVHIVHLFADGSDSLMTVLTPGDFAGVDLVCTRTQLSPYFAMAASTVQVFYLPFSCLLALADPQCRLELQRQLLQLISNENMKKEYRIAILSQRGLRDRILAYLTMQASRLRRQTFAIAFSRDEMASYLCVNRSALSHELSRMEQEGLIRFHKNIFTLTAPALTEFQP